MTTEEFETIWQKAASAPKLTEVPVRQLAPDMSLDKVVDFIDHCAEAANQRGQITKAALDTMLTHTKGLREALKTVDPQKTLLASEMRERARLRVLK